MASETRRQLRSVIRKHDLVKFKHLLKHNPELLNCVISDIHHDNLLSYCVRHGYLEEVEYLMNLIRSMSELLNHDQATKVSNSICDMIGSQALVYNKSTMESVEHDHYHCDQNPMNHDNSKLISTNQTNNYHMSKCNHSRSNQNPGSMDISTNGKSSPIVDLGSSILDSLDRNHLTVLDIAIHGWLRVVHCSPTEPKTAFARRYVTKFYYRAVHSRIFWVIIQ